MAPKNKAMIQMLVCATLWSIAGIFFKWLDLNAFVIAGFRSLFAALTVLAYMGWRKEKIVFTRNVFLGGIFQAGTFFAFVAANKLTTAANAIVLQYVSPVFILIISALFLKERLRLSDVLAVLFALVGISFFFLDQLDGGGMLGNLLAVLAGLSMALMFLVVKRASASERMSCMLTGHGLTALIGIPFLFFTENHMTWQSVGFLLILGVVQLGVPYILYGLAAEHCPPLACSLLATVEPLLNPVWVALFYGETPSAFSLFGGFIVIASITIWCVWKGRHPLPAEM